MVDRRGLKRKRSSGSVALSAYRDQLFKVKEQLQNRLLSKIRQKSAIFWREWHVYEAILSLCRSHGLRFASCELPYRGLILKCS